MQEKIPNVPKTIEELEPIEQSRNLWFATRDDISRFVEAPLLKACEILWDKNIRTLSTSANAKDLYDGFGYIIIDFDNLSEENQQIAQTLAEPVEYDGMIAVKIEIPLKEGDTAQDVEMKALEVANQFKTQDATWIPIYTLDEVKQIYAIPEEEEVDPQDFVGPQGEGGLYYDPEEQLFYLSEEHHHKVRGR